MRIELTYHRHCHDNGPLEIGDCKYGDHSPKDTREIVVIMHTAHTAIFFLSGGVT